MTSEAGREQSGRRREILFAVLASLLSLVILLIFLRSPGIGGFDRATVSGMVYGTAYKPFVYRTLLPTLVRVSTTILPSATPVALKKAIAGSPRLVQAIRKMDWEEDFLPEYCYATVFMYASLVGFVYALRHFLTSVLPEIPWTWRWSASIAAIAGLPPFFWYQNYLYDFPTLLFFALGLLLLHQRRWLLFFPVYALSCFNKETTILLTVLTFWTLRDGSPRREMWRVVMIQVVIFAASRVVLDFAYGGNPGMFIELKIFPHNLSLLTSYSLTSFVVVLACVFILASSWRQQPAFVRYALLVTGVLLPAGLLFGFADELRDYYETYPALVAMATNAVWLRHRPARAYSPDNRPGTQ